MDESHASQEKKIESDIRIFSIIAWFLGILGVGIIVFGIFIYRPLAGKVDHLTNLGTFLQGAVASIWALAGVVLIYVAFLGQKKQLIYQQEELRQNREELELTRKELQAQKEQMEVQNETLKLQRFESYFFELLGFQNKITESLKSDSSTATYGRDCFKYPLGTIYGVFAEKNSQGRNMSLENLCENIFIQNQGMIGHYLIHLLNIFQFIDQTELNNNEKQKYVNIVRSQLSLIEKKTIFYYGLTKKGKEYWNVICNYGLVKDILPKDLADPSHINYYPHDIFDDLERLEIPLSEVLGDTK